MNQREKERDLRDSSVLKAQGKTMSAVVVGLEGESSVTW